VAPDAIPNAQRRSCTALNLGGVLANRVTIDALVEPVVECLTLSPYPLPAVQYSCRTQVETCGITRSFCNSKFIIWV